MGKENDIKLDEWKNARAGEHGWLFQHEGKSYFITVKLGDEPPCDIWTFLEHGSKLQYNDQANIRLKAKARKEFAKGAGKMFGIPPEKVELAVSMAAVNAAKLAEEAELSETIKESDNNSPGISIQDSSQNGSDEEPTQPSETIQKLMKDPNLIGVVVDVLQKKHVGDKRSISLLWFQCAGGILPPEYRAGGRIGGPTSAGKDNAVNTVLANLPDWLYMALTETSSKYLQRKLEDLPPVIYFKEMNLNQKGANSDRVEILKALLEDGYTYAFLEQNGKTWVPVEVKTERRVCMWSTTEVGSDDELLNRVNGFSFKGGPMQTKAVISHIAKESSTVENMVRRRSDITILKELLTSVEKVDYVVMPFLTKLEQFIDNSQESARRFFRLLRNCISWVAFVHQAQRTVEAREIDGISKKFLTAEPIDLFIALILLGDGLRSSYTGLEPRIEKAVEAIREFGGEGGFVPMSTIKVKMKLNKKQSWQVFSELANLNLIETKTNPDDKRTKVVTLIDNEYGNFLNATTEELIKALGCGKEVKEFVVRMNSYFSEGNLSEQKGTYLGTYISDQKPASSGVINATETEKVPLVPAPATNQQKLAPNRKELVYDKIAASLDGIKIGELEGWSLDSGTIPKDDSTDFWGIHYKLLEEGRTFMPKKGWIRIT